MELGSRSRINTFLRSLDDLLKASRQRLSDTFKQFDTDNSGTLDWREMSKFLSTLLPEVSSSDVAVLTAWLDMNGDGAVRLEELMEAIKEALTARKLFMTVCSFSEMLTSMLELHGSASYFRRALCCLHTVKSICLPFVHSMGRHCKQLPPVVCC